MKLFKHLAILLGAAVLAVAGPALAESFDTYASSRSVPTTVVDSEYLLVVQAGVVKKVKITSVDVKRFGAVGDALSGMIDGTVSASSTAFCASSRTFSSADIGKTVILDKLGSAHAPLVTTFSAFVSTHCMTLAAAVTYAGPYSEISALTVSTSQSGSGSYVPGDTLTVSGGTAIAAATGTVKLTKVISATVNAGGSGGTDGTCTVVGTTGTALAGQRFIANVTISSGAITAVNSITTAGHYSANPTTIAQEPVTSSSGCGSITGAKLAVKMGVDQAQMTSGGSYTSLPSSPVSTTTSGSGTGATFTYQSITTQFAYGTDDSAAFLAAQAWAATRNAAGGFGCIDVPVGEYLLGVGNIASTNGLCWLGGGGQTASTLVMKPNTAGDLFACSECWLGSTVPFNGSTSKAYARTTITALRDLHIVGFRSSTQRQNAFMFYDRNDLVDMANVFVEYVNGSCFSAGTLQNGALGYIRESPRIQMQCWNGGRSGVPAVEITADGTAGGTSDIGVDLNIYSPYGPGFVIRNNGASNAGVRGVEGFVRVEGLEGNAAVIAGDLLQIGDATAPGQVSNINLHGLLISPYNDYYALHITAHDSTVKPYDINWDGPIKGGSPYGGGVYVEAGKQSTIKVGNNNSLDYNLKVASSTLISDGVRVGPDLSDWTYSQDATSANFIHHPVYSTPQGSTNAFSLNVPDSTAAGGNARGASAVDLQVSRVVATQVASGTRTVIAGGRSNQATGTDCVILGGLGNVCSGTDSAIPGGGGANDFGRKGILCFSSGVIAAGSQQQACITTLWQTTTGAAAVRLTSDGDVAGSRNCLNLTAGPWADTVSIRLTAINRTTGTVSYSWSLPDGFLVRSSDAASTTWAAGTPVIHSNGTVTGAAVSAAADTTNACLNLQFTPPTGNTDTWDISARVDVDEVK